MERTLMFRRLVSIPMTVLGGLQFDKVCRDRDTYISFNTDDGIRRAAIPTQIFGESLENSFQYR